jgi:hypothetical protein
MTYNREFLGDDRAIFRVGIVHHWSSDVIPESRTIVLPGVKPIINFFKVFY